MVDLGKELGLARSQLGNNRVREPAWCRGTQWEGLRTHKLGSSTKHAASELPNGENRLGTVNKQ